MFKVNDKVKCYNFLCTAINMEKTYTVKGVQLGFDKKVFLHLKETKIDIAYDSEHFKLCLD